MSDTPKTDSFRSTKPWSPVADEWRAFCAVQELAHQRELQAWEGRFQKAVSIMHLLHMRLSKFAMACAVLFVAVVVLTVLYLTK